MSLLDTLLGVIKYGLNEMKLGLGMIKDSASYRNNKKVSQKEGVRKNQK